MAIEINREVKEKTLQWLTNEYYRVERSSLSEKKKTMQTLSIFEIMDFIEGLEKTKPQKETFSHLVV